jgi:hypothetical protein
MSHQNMPQCIQSERFLFDQMRPSDREALSRSLTAFRPRGLDRPALQMPRRRNNDIFRQVELYITHYFNVKQGASPHLRRLEAEAIFIMREVVAEFERPVMLYSIGKDSSVMLHLAQKASFPAKPPFPLLHIDTTWKFRETRRSRAAGRDGIAGPCQ